ncbi:MAG: GAF domain-containing sensor histidine kinase [Gemmatimonadota bacterium]|nr:MAG: GAF domain-containing sensor histidine kinase [Gemmatimonadota bacterium]
MPLFLLQGMDLSVPASATSELAAAFLQTAITLGLVLVCAFLYRQYRKPYFGWLALAWALYAVRLGAILSFVYTSAPVWLYWHQVITGWTALALLGAALVFSQGLRWRHWYWALVLFPPLWSYVAIYRLDNFLLAAGPAVLFLSMATLWTGWVFLRYHRLVGSAGAVVLAVSLFLWSLHHLDYPWLRARGVWNPWGYYLDIVFELALGLGILLLVLEDVRRGLGTLSALSSDLQRTERGDEVLERLLEPPLTLPGVRGSAMYLLRNGQGRLAAGAGLCAQWPLKQPVGTAARAVSQTLVTGRPEFVRDDVPRRARRDGWYAYAAALPIFMGGNVAGALLIVGDARDPFAALDERFLVALGQQMGAALESADLYQRLAERSRELERLAARMVQQHEEERHRLSRELHDETGQVFSAVRLKLGVMRESATEDEARRLDDALALMDKGIRSIRNVTNDLRPSLLDDLGLLPALRALVHDFGEQSGLYTRVSAPDEVPDLSDEAEVALFRALQEGLSNVARHAEARSVTVRVRLDAGRLVLSVRDDGRGPPGAHPQELERRGHMGLAGMRERITALGGTVALRGAPGEGVELVVRIPLGDVEAE